MKRDLEESFAVEFTGDSRVKGMIPMPTLFLVTLTERESRELFHGDWTLTKPLIRRLWRMLGRDDIPPQKAEMAIARDVLLDAKDRIDKEDDLTHTPLERERGFTTSDIKL